MYLLVLSSTWLQQPALANASRLGTPFLTWAAEAIPLQYYLLPPGMLISRNLYWKQRQHFQPPNFRIQSGGLSLCAITLFPCFSCHKTPASILFRNLGGFFFTSGVHGLRDGEISASPKEVDAAYQDFLKMW